MLQRYSPSKSGMKMDANVSWKCANPSGCLVYFKFTTRRSLWKYGECYGAWSTNSTHWYPAAWDNSYWDFSTINSSWCFFEKHSTLAVLACKPMWAHMMFDWSVELNDKCVADQGCIALKPILNVWMILLFRAPF